MEENPKDVDEKRLLKCVVASSQNRWTANNFFICVKNLVIDDKHRNPGSVYNEGGKCLGEWIFGGALFVALARKIKYFYCTNDSKNDPNHFIMFLE